MFPSIFAFCAWIIGNSSQFDPKIVLAASGALFVDILGVVVAAWKILLSPQTQGQLKPVTDKVALATVAPSHVDASNPPAEANNKARPTAAPNAQSLHNAEGESTPE
jgi:hypothetical protein